MSTEPGPGMVEKLAVPTGTETIPRWREGLGLALLLWGRLQPEPL